MVCRQVGSRGDLSYYGWQRRHGWSSRELFGVDPALTDVGLLGQQPGAN